MPAVEIAATGATIVSWPSSDPATYQRIKKKQNKKKLTTKVVVHINISAEVGNTFARQRQRSGRLRCLRHSAGRRHHLRRLGASGARRCLRRLARCRGARFRRQRRLASAGGRSLRSPPLPLRPSFMQPHSRLAFLRRPLAILVHHCRHNSSDIPPVRKNSPLTNHARCKSVLVSRAGDRNIPRPTTPGNPQHPSRRLPELERRHPFPRGRARPHQLSSKTIRNPKSSHSSTSFSLFRGWGGRRRKVVSSLHRRFLPTAVRIVLTRVAVI
jgi:hypothetical protein